MRLVVGFTATAQGWLPTGMVATTVLVSPSMTDTSSLYELVTYMRLAAGFTAMSLGYSSSSRWIVATTVFVSPSMTEM